MLSAPNQLRSRPALVLAALLALAAVLRLAALFSLRETIYFEHLLYDEQLYHDWAVALAAGEPGAILRYDQSSLPAFLLAGIYRLLGPEPLFFRLLNILLGTLTCYLVYQLGRRLAGTGAGLLACAIAALYGPFILYSIVPLKTCLAVFLFALVAVLGIELPEPPASRSRFALHLLALGIAVGLAAGVRANALVLALLPPLFLLTARESPGGRARRAVGGTLLFAFGLALVLACLLLPRYLAGGGWSATSPQLGRNLYYGNSPENPTPYYRPMPFASSVPGESSVQFIIEAGRRAGRELTPREASRFWVGEVLAFIKEQPGEWGLHLGQKVLALFNRFEAGDHYDLHFLGRFVRFFTLPWPGYGLVMALAMTGMVLTIRTSPVSRRLALLAGLYSLGLVVFYLNGRYRLPLAVILTPWAAVGVIEAVRAVRERRRPRLVLAGVIFAAFSLLSLLPVRGGGDLSAYANTHALLLANQGQEEEAVRFWEESVRMGGDYADVARLFLAGRLYGRGERERVWRLLAEIGDASHAAAAKYSLLGDLQAYEGRLDEAVRSYERSLSINSGQRRIRVELIRLYQQKPEWHDRVFEQYEKLQRIEGLFQAAGRGNFLGKREQR
ncbi:MAG: hypothetical protein C4563_09305 [Desulfobulbus sp.]|nr:MAG: hypothetical protein C4563_09305 [Desulfobulbus sp.]